MSDERTGYAVAASKLAACLSGAEAALKASAEARSRQQRDAELSRITALLDRAEGWLAHARRG